MNLLLCNLSLLLCASPQSEGEEIAVTPIKVGQTITEDFLHDKVHHYEFHAPQGARVEGWIVQDGINVRVDAFDPSGQSIREFDFFKKGVDPFRFRADADGSYRLIVTPVESDFGEYSLHLAMAEPEAKGLEARANQYLSTFPPEADGTVFAVIKDGEVLFQGKAGLANPPKARPLDYDVKAPDNYWDESFMTFAILKLCDENKIRLDQDVHQILPNFPEFKSPVAVKDLLDNRSGLREMYQVLQFKKGDIQYLPTIDEMAEELSRQRELNFTPDWKEDSLPFTQRMVLRAIISQVAGQEYETWVEQNVFSPLDMDAARYQALSEEEIFSRPTLSFQDWVAWVKLLTTYAEDDRTWQQRLEKWEFGAHGTRWSWGKYWHLRTQNAWVIHRRARLSEITVKELAEFLLEDGPWPIKDPAPNNDVGLGGGAGGRFPGDPRRKVLATALAKLAATYRSEELQMDFELRLVGEDLHFYYSSGKHFPLSISSNKKKTLLCDNWLFNEAVLSNAVDGELQEIRISGNGFENLLFKRINDAATL